MEMNEDLRREILLKDAEVQELKESSKALQASVAQLKENQADPAILKQY